MLATQLWAHYHSCADTLRQLIVEQLIERIPASEVGVSVRDLEKAHALVERGLRRGDFGDHARLRHSFEGASQLPDHPQRQQR